jgi:hypothetical protein
MWLRRLIQRSHAASHPDAVAARSTSTLAGSDSPSTQIQSNSSSAIYAPTVEGEPLRQGEVLTGVIQRRRSFRSLSSETPEMEEIRHPYVIVVTQDCDLEQDHRARTSAESPAIPIEKLMPNILFVQAVTWQELIAGLPKGKDIMKRVMQNKDERYQVIEQIDAPVDAAGEGVPALGVDFRRCFTVPTDEVYVQLSSNARRRCRLNSPYLEHFSKRFADFLNRVALPRDHRVG